MSTLLYNPDRKDKQQFLAEFVIRTEIFDQIFNDIKSGKMLHPEQHYLLVGQRGAGKTTLLNRLKYAIDDDAKLNKWLIPILFNEEQYHISEPANIWENIATYLEDYYGFEGICDEIEQQLSKEDFEDKALQVLLNRLDGQKKKIILFIDNIGDLLNKFDKLQIHRLREVLQTKAQIRIIAGSTLSLESLTDYQQPLFEFFKVVRLEGLSYEECLALLRKLSDVYNEQEKIETIIKKSPSRIETLRVLSGGVPRTIALLFHVFIDNEHGTALSDLEKVLDYVTPLYKHRMDDLPTQQQKILDAVAKNWDPISVKQLVIITRLESKALSAQLKQLERNQVIDILTTGKKNHTYMLKERFYNIWYLMRYGRKQDRRRVIWLVKFLEVWCSKEEIEKRITNYISKYKSEQLDDRTAQVFGLVYSYFENIDSGLKYQLKNNSPAEVKKSIIYAAQDYKVLFETFFEEKSWENLIRLFMSKEKLSDEEKSYILNLLIDSEKITEQEFAVAMLKVLGELRRDAPLPLFVVNLTFASCYRLIVDINPSAEENLKSYVQKLVQLSNKLYDHRNFGDFESDKILNAIIILLVNDCFNICDVLFNSSIGGNRIADILPALAVAKSLLVDFDLEKQYPNVAPEIMSEAKEVANMVLDIKRNVENESILSYI